MCITVAIQKKNIGYQIFLLSTFVFQTVKENTTATLYQQLFINYTIVSLEQQVDINLDILARQTHHRA